MKSEEVAFQCWLLVYNFFKENANKTNVWFEGYNPLLGSSPKHMIEIGREEKLLKFIKNCLEENAP